MTLTDVLLLAIAGTSMGILVLIALSGLSAVIERSDPSSPSSKPIAHRRGTTTELSRRVKVALDALPSEPLRRRSTWKPVRPDLSE